MLYMFPTTPNYTKGANGQKTITSFNKEALELAPGQMTPKIPKGYHGAKVTGIQLFSSNVPNENIQLSPLVGNERSGIQPATGIQQLTIPGLPQLK